jgi:hypothetical protein
MRQEEKSYQFGFLAGLTTADRLDLLQQYPEIDKAAAIHDAEEMALKKGLNGNGIRSDMTVVHKNTHGEYITPDERDNWFTLHLLSG